MKLNQEQESVNYNVLLLVAFIYVLFLNFAITYITFDLKNKHLTRIISYAEHFVVHEF